MVRHRVSVTSLTTSVSTMRFLIEIMFILKAIKYHFNGSYDKQNRGHGRVVRKCWVNFQCQGVLLTWLTVGQGPIVLSVGAVGGCLDIFSLIYHFSFLSPSLWETARYRLKYCLKGPLSPNQPTNQPSYEIYETSLLASFYMFHMKWRQGSFNKFHMKW